MKLLSLFVSTDLQAFAETLANDLAKRYPPELDQKTDKGVSVNRLTRVVEDTCERARAYRDEKHLGWLGKSRLANHFHWALTNRGYTSKFVDFATEALVVYLTKPTK